PAPNGFAGAPNLLDEIEARIRAEEDPAVVAAAFVLAMADPAVKAEIEEVGGVVNVFVERLGDWANDHTDYAQALLAEIQQRAVAAGIKPIYNEDEEDAGAAE